MLLLILQSHQQTCHLQAEVPAGIMATATNRLGKGKIQTLCQAELTIVQGQVQSCLIRDQRERQVMLQGQIAFDLLQLCGVLSWSVQAEPQASSQLPIIEEGPDDGQTEKSQSSLPRQTTLLEQRQITMLPRKHRQVLNLVNGQRGINELCRLLHCTRDQLMEILADLAADHLITLADPDDRSDTRRK
jgi:hypothetical protein